MSEDSGAIDPVVLVTVLCIIAAFAGAIVCAYRTGIKREARMKEFAGEHGWGFSRNDTEKLGAKIETYFPKQRFSTSMIVTIETGGRTIRLFDCTHRSYDGKDSSHFSTGCIIESPGFRTNGAGRDIVEIFDRAGLDSLLAFDQVDVGSSEFSKNFIVVSKNRIAAKNVVTPALQSLLLGRREAPLVNTVSIEINATGAVALTGRDPSPERMLDLIELCRKIERSMP